MNVPRVMVAGTHSGVGKTTVSIGIMSALKELGFKIQPFKVGPDYIDPSYHNTVTGRFSENLDSWMIPHDQIIELFKRATLDADLAVIEGVMGLYDGVSGLDETGSSAETAKILKCPVILVIDAHDMARTSAALVLGFKKFDENVNLAGVIVNRVGSQTHALWCKEAIESAVKIPVIGSLPAIKEIELPERHLGLIPTAETKTFNPLFPRIGNFVRDNINLNMVVQIAKSAGEASDVQQPVYPASNQAKRVIIGVAFDEAFNFYYPSNLSILTAYGAEIKRFSLIHDKQLPTDIHGLYIGGGFPEMLPKELAANENMLKTIKKAAENGMPIYAECGGLMYLTDSIEDFDGDSFKMVGLLNGKTVMTKKTLINYTLAEVTSENSFVAKGSQLKGHEFHCSQIVDIPADAKFAYIMKKGEGTQKKQDGWIRYNVLASYMHVPFVQDKKIVPHFISNCEKYKRQISLV
jgi:cobyrinic acid a,c-diamide synthase